MANNTKTMTVAQLKAELWDLLSNAKDDDLVFFGSGDLSFHRLKERGPTDGPRLVQIEFNEPYKVYTTD